MVGRTCGHRITASNAVLGPATLPGVNVEERRFSAAIDEHQTGLQPLRGDLPNK